MKTRYIHSIIFFFCLFINAESGFSQQTKNNFQGGEKLKFLLYYGPFDGGLVEAELKVVKFNGKDVFYSQMKAKTIGLTDRLFKVRDEYSAIFDPVTLLPYKSVRDISEGKYTKKNIVHYFHDQHYVINIKQDTFQVPSDVRDMVSVFHYIRNLDFNSFKEGHIIKINTFFDNEIFPFDMRYKGTEQVTTRMGTFNCIKLVPFVEPGRIFNKEDDMAIWLSDDFNRVPIRVRFNLKVGSVKCDLIEFTGLKY